MTTTLAAQPNFKSVPRAFWWALGLNFVWINLSEVFRYFVFVMPMMRDAFPNLETIAPMNLQVFLIWGLWDTILVFSATIVPWLILTRFGSGLRIVLISGSFVWLTIFGLLWLGLYNMNLATTGILAIALPLAWVEMVAAAGVVAWTMNKTAKNKMLLE